MRNDTEPVSCCMSSTILSVVNQNACLHIIFFFKNKYVLCISHVIYIYIYIYRFIMNNNKKTRINNITPLKPNFYIVRLRLTGVYIILLIYAQSSIVGTC